MILGQADTAPDVTAVFLQYGVLGAVSLLGLWFFLTTYRDLKAQRDECQEQAAAKDTLLREQAAKHQAESVALLNTVLPLLTQATMVLAEAIAEVRRVREQR